MRDRSPLWIAFVDMLLAVVAVVIVAVAPHTPKTKGPDVKAEFIIFADWSVETDADVDLWVLPPSGKPLMYTSREVGCATLDRDSRGFLDDHVTLADGSTVKVVSNKETATLRCIEPGRYDVGVHLYAYRGASPYEEKNGYHLKVHIEIIRLNPQIKTEWAGDIILDRHWQFINTVSFELTRDGKLTLVDPPLEPLTKGFYSQSTIP